MELSSQAGVPPPSDHVQRLLAAMHDLADIDDGGDLGTVLQQTVEIACEMTGARYGAMGVLSEDDGSGLSHFITHGMSAQQRRLIGDPPAESGVLGRLIADPVAVRVVDVTLQEDAVGFPPGHPVMHAFLGAPIRTGSRVFGNLYLTEKAHGAEFSEHDEWLLNGFASLAGVVIDLVRRRLVADGQQSMVSTIRQLNRSLLTEGDPAAIVPVVIDEAIRATGASAVAVAAVRDEGDPRVELIAGSGQTSQDLLDMHAARITQGINDARSMHWSSEASTPLVDQQAGPRHTSIVPIQLRDGTWAVMVVDGWRAATLASPRLSEELIESLGDQVGLVLDRVAADDSHDALTKVADRERIARDLHDLVIQRIFAAGLTLQGAARMRPEPEVLQRVEQTIDELDATIRDIRATIFALSPTRAGAPLQAEISELVKSYAQNLGFAPTVSCSPGVESAIDDDSRLTLLLVLREALSNVARHARATAVEIAIHLEAEHVVVVVTDDGVGLPPRVVESGLGNVRARARQRGGSMDLMAHTPRGTVLRWQVPLR
ncbi:MAG: GAF domain-containing protein [Ornithinimicrobium sp.]